MNYYESAPLLIKRNNNMSQEIAVNRIHCDFSKESDATHQQVMMINAKAGNRITDASQYPAQIQRQTLIDLGECFELLTAVVEGDISELRDGLADKQVTLSGFANILPFSLSDDFNHTIKNQHTRFDYTVEDALATQQKYAAIGVETYIERNEIVTNLETIVAYVNKVKADCTDTRGESYNTGKFVKSINYVNDDFSGTEYGNLLPTDYNSQKERYLAIRKRVADWLAKMDHEHLPPGEV